ncbi:MAG: hypothetical protein AB7I25_09975 [Vicinamibacterales bacterium]
MENLGTTNVILAVIAATSVVQVLLIVAVVLWAGRQFAKLKEELVALRTIAEHANGVSRELENVAGLLREMVGNVTAEVNRAAGGVHAALDLIEALYTGASAIGGTVKSGLLDLLRDFFRNRARRAGHDGSGQTPGGPVPPEL